MNNSTNSDNGAPKEPESNEPDHPAPTQELGTNADRPVESTVSFRAGGNKPAEPPVSPKAKQAIRPVINGYEIIDELGRGGMGVVYLANQIGLKRLVAIKMLLTGEQSDAEQMARFKSEAQAVAALEHPNIVHIYEINEHIGLPFFSMEFVPGGSLARTIAGTPQSAMDAAALMETIARAVHAAHLCNIVHRDLKPANILITYADQASTLKPTSGSTRTPGAPTRSEPNPDPKPGPSARSATKQVSTANTLRTAIPKVTDFGLAKRLEMDSLQTRTGTIMGTPSYMAPEQAQGLVREVGPLSDVYSLGAILYELLTGRAPFLAASMFDTLQAVISSEPVPPSRLEPKVPRDLETICLKCLHKEPRKRYDSAEALADDLHRFVIGEPILARPVSATERLWRWSLRNPKLALATGASLLLLLTVTAVSSWSAFTLANKNQLIQKEKQAAVAAQHAETVARKAADENAKAATQQATENLVTIQTVIENVNQGLSEVPGTQRVRENVLKFVAQRISAVATAVDKSTSKEATDLSARRALGNLYGQIGASDKSFDYLKQALEIARERVVIKNRSDASRLNLAIVLQDLGHVCQEFRRDMQLAAAYYDEARAVRQEILERPNPGDGTPANRALVQKLLGEDHARVATTLFRIGNPQAALQQFEESLKVRSELAKLTKSLDIRQDLIRSRLAVAEMKFRLGDAESIRPAYTDAIAERETLLAETNPSSLANFKHELARTLGNFGDICLFMDDLASARTNYTRFHDLMRELAGSDEELLSYQRDLGLAWYRLGNLALRSMQQTEADQYFANCLAVRQSVADKDATNDRRQMELMLALAHCGEHERAAALAEKYRSSRSPDNEMLIDVVRCFAQCSVVDSGGQSLQTVYRDQAIATLAAAVANGYQDIVFLRCEPDLEPLRETEGFKEIVRRQPTP